MKSGLSDSVLRSLVHRLHNLGAPGQRVIVGLAGAPGAGKTTLAAELAAALGAQEAVVIPMDGFHIATHALESDEQRQRRGAIDTFDAAGFSHLLQRLRERTEPVVYAPAFSREVDEPIGSAIPVPHTVGYLIVEGNYLLDDDRQWQTARSHLDEVWFIDIDPELRRRRLAARHIRFGRTPEQAQRWANGSDEVNAEKISSRRSAADLIIEMAPAPLCEV